MNLEVTNNTLTLKLDNFSDFQKSIDDSLLGILNKQNIWDYHYREEPLIF